MPKKKLKFDAALVAKLPLATFLTGVELSDPFKAGGQVFFESTYKSENDLVSLGMQLGKITDSDVSEFAAQQAKEAEKQKAAKAAKEQAVQPVKPLTKTK